MSNVQWLNTIEWMAQFYKLIKFGSKTYSSRCFRFDFNFTRLIQKSIWFCLHTHIQVIMTLVMCNAFSLSDIFRISFTNEWLISNKQSSRNVRQYGLLLIIFVFQLVKLHNVYVRQTMKTSNYRYKRTHVNDLCCTQFTMQSLTYICKV